MADNKEEKIEAGDVVMLKTTKAIFTVEKVNGKGNLKLTRFDENTERVTLDNIAPSLVVKQS